MPHLVSIMYTPAGIDPRPPDRYARIERTRATLVVGHGIAGDTKGTKGRRQLNVMRAETVAALRAEGFRAGPGELGEQLVIAGLAEADLARGTLLRLGESAVIAITGPRTP